MYNKNPLKFGQKLKLFRKKLESNKLDKVSDSDVLTEFGHFGDWTKFRQNLDKVLTKSLPIIFKNFFSWDNLHIPTQPSVEHMKMLPMFPFDF